MAASTDDAIVTCVARLAEWAAQSLPANPAHDSFLCAETFRRYAVARDGDFDKAKELLAASVAWRVTNVPARLHCPACEVEPHSHCFFPIGLDAHRRVVIYANAAKAKMNEKEVTVQHMCHALEHAWRATDKLQLHSQWVWIIDFGGFSWWNAMQTNTSGATIQTFSDQMPERMGAILLLNPPRLFDVLLAAIRPFVNAKTMSKVSILRCDSSTIGACLEPHGVAADSGVSAWVARVLAMPTEPGHVPSRDGLDLDVLAALSLDGMCHGLPSLAPR